MVFSRVCRHQKRFTLSQKRWMAIYTLGDGWTGALGTGSLSSYAAGHDDEEDPDEPFLIHDGPVDSVSAGWGHTAFTSNGSLYVSGRAYELSNLLRLKRLPSFLRDFAISGTIKKDDKNNEAFQPTIVSRAMSRIVEMATPEEEFTEMGSGDKQSILFSPTIIDLPEGEKTLINTSSLEYEHSLDTSACFTAIKTQKGNLYSFGSNSFGQCGIGEASPVVWTPTPIVGLSSNSTEEGNSEKNRAHITQISLGLQHGLALNSNGEVYAWGKGERGQLGIKGLSEESSSIPQRITRFRLPPSKDGAQQWIDNARVVEISAGMNHSVARTDDNLLFVWGKLVSAPTEEKGKIAQDSTFPTMVKGLPENVDITKISCGSHHTSVLLENGGVYAFGKPMDNSTPVFEATEILPPGVIDMPVRQFKAHFDVTTIVGKNGDQVLQFHFWNDEEMRDVALYTPTWMDHFSDPIRSVHRGLLHTVVAT